MIKEIFCAKCGKYMGEIRDATLRKGAITYCLPCDNRRQGVLQQTDNNSDVMSNFFDGLMSKGGRWPN